MKKKLPKLGFLYLDYVLRFYDKSNFKEWPDKIEKVVYHWGSDKDRFIKEVKRKKIDILIGNIPATAYETFREIEKALPKVRFVPSLATQYSNKSKENVTKFCKMYNLPHPETKIFYDRKKGFDYLKRCGYPKIIKRSYGPSNYGGYYVHKVDSYKEAKELFEKKKYHPMYVQECVPIKKDIRVMLIGHKPICAFWRVAGAGAWITNTSQGGSMDYLGVPNEALKVAIKASKAAKAEYFACDIAESSGKYYIFECATAFAAFSYVRDWIGQYLMWDFSKGAIKKPHIPLYNWEELGKMSSFVLRRLRHVTFSKNVQIESFDGEKIIKDKKDIFEMELTLRANDSDIPDDSNFDKDVLIFENSSDGDENSSATQPKEDIEVELHSDELEFSSIMSLKNMREDLASEIIKLKSNKERITLKKLLNLGATKSEIELWREIIIDKVDINKASVNEFLEVEGIGKKIAKDIVDCRKEINSFKNLDELLKVRGISAKKLSKIKDYIKV